MNVSDIKHAGIKAWVEECVKMCETMLLLLTVLQLNMTAL